MIIIKTAGIFYWSLRRWVPWNSLAVLTLKCASGRTKRGLRDLRKAAEARLLSQVEHIFLDMLFLLVSLLIFHVQFFVSLSHSAHFLLPVSGSSTALRRSISFVWFTWAFLWLMFRQHFCHNYSIDSVLSPHWIFLALFSSLPAFNKIFLHREIKRWILFNEGWSAEAVMNRLMGIA